jgi:hypothetical protein
MGFSALRYVNDTLKKQNQVDSVAEKALTSLQLNSPPSASAYLDHFIVHSKLMFLQISSFW